MYRLKPCRREAHANSFALPCEQTATAVGQQCFGLGPRNRLSDPCLSWVASSPGRADLPSVPPAVLQSTLTASDVSDSCVQSVLALHAPSAGLSFSGSCDESFVRHTARY